jgi:hypothetical protein
MMNDQEKLDELIRNAAQEYNRPPISVPRDEMWAAIDAARAERARRPVQVVSASPRRSFTRITWLGAAAAAVLMIGIGIGRMSTSPVPGTRYPTSGTRYPVPGTRNPLPETGTTAPQVANAEPESSNPVTSAGQSGTGQREAGAAQRTSRSRNRVPGTGQRVADTGNRVPDTGYRVPGTGYQAPDAGLSYQMATIRHLSNAEALLTAFHNDSHDAKMDAQLSLWARDLLSNTRLLLDSPAADDPQRAKLLGDLELVLAEIVQLSPGASAQDRGLVEGSIQNGHVMTRLRSAIPAGQTRGL